MSEIENNIVTCYEKRRNGQRPTTLRTLGVDRIVGREIIKWDQSLGTYGMGGPGFAGMLLSKTHSSPEEWLILTLWGADNWLLLDGRWVNAHPKWYDEQRPWNGWGKERWNEFTPIVVGTRILEAHITDNESLIHIENLKLRKRYLLELPQDTMRLSRTGGSEQFREWNHTESHLDAWVISRTGHLYC